jgi:transcriptional regulator with XRE-family HTH domain
MGTSSADKANAFDAQRRSRLRHPVKLHAVGRGAGGGGSFEGLLINLSSEGFLLETTTELAFGESFELDLPGAGGLAARIAWESAPLYGCEFVHPLDKSLVSQSRLKSEPDEPRAQKALTIGSEIERLRDAKGWTRADLAQKAGVSRPSVWGWETGKTKPRQEALRRLARAFGCDVTTDKSMSCMRPQIDCLEEVMMGTRNADSEGQKEYFIADLVSALRLAVSDRLNLQPNQISVRIGVEV